MSLSGFLHSTLNNGDIDVSPGKTRTIQFFDEVDVAFGQLAGVIYIVRRDTGSLESVLYAVNMSRLSQHGISGKSSIIFLTRYLMRVSYPEMKVLIDP